jgi:hypothetical protein
VPSSSAALKSNKMKIIPPSISVCGRCKCTKDKSSKVKKLIKLAKSKVKSTKKVSKKKNKIN